MASKTILLSTNRAWCPIWKKQCDHSDKEAACHKISPQGLTLWPISLMLMVVTTLAHMQAQIPAGHWPLNGRKRALRQEWVDPDGSETTNVGTHIENQWNNVIMNKRVSLGHGATCHCQPCVTSENSVSVYHVIMTTVIITFSNRSWHSDLLIQSLGCHAPYPTHTTDHKQLLAETLSS